MEEAYSIASKNAEKSSERGKKSRDRKISKPLLVGDRVLVRNNKSPGGPAKLKSYWEDQIHIVTKRMGNDMPVYEVKSEDGCGRTKVVITM